MEAYCDVLIELGRDNYEPALIVGTSHVTKDQRTNLAYVGHATEAILLRRIKESAFVHVDETKINIEGAEHHVWVFIGAIVFPCAV
jgi:hypothetical protein